jgi:hypothetical protein
MGDFGEGIDQENTMLSEMAGYNSQIKEAKQVRDQFLSGQLATAKEETAKEKDPTKLGEDVTQISQVASKTAAARKVFSSTYGSNLGAYAKGLGRTGEETTLGLRPALKAAKTISGLTAPSSFRPGAVSSSSLEGATQQLRARTGMGGAASADTVAGKPIRAVPDLQQEITTRPVPPTEPTPVTQVRPSGAEPQAPPTAEAAGAEGAGAEAESLASKGAKLAGTAGEVVGHVGVGLGILGGAESFASDMAGGHFHLSGDNTAEKTGNALSMAGGALDTMSLVAPPLAILGGILGIGSAIADAIGHLEHSHKKVAAVKTEEAAPPAETPMGVTSLAAIGQVASQGSDMLHTITGTTAF